jgi:hypothetical protein
MSTNGLYISVRFTLAERHSKTNEICEDVHEDLEQQLTEAFGNFFVYMTEGCQDSIPDDFLEYKVVVLNKRIELDRLVAIATSAAKELEQSCLIIEYPTTTSIVDLSKSD